ncbi:DUF6882 domain-containing protein [Nocardiopsis flavescens]
MTAHTLVDMLDDAALMSFEHQLHLQEFLGEHSWNADLQAGRFEFTGERPLVCDRFHLMGSAAPGPGSWMWGWANPSGFPPDLTAMSAAVRDFGREHDVPELASAEVAFGDLPGAPREVPVVVGQLTDAAKLLTGRWFSYNGEVGGGTRVAFIIEHSELRLPEPEPARVMRVMQQGLADLRLSDHRRALYTYGRLRGLSPRFTDEGRGTLLLSLPGLDADISFDHLGRVGGINASLSAPGA